MLMRPIPSSGEALPILGLGTYRGFDVGSGAAERSRLAGVLEALFRSGGSVIDSSPMYGRAEAVAGESLAATAARGKAFVATKVWTRGREAGIRQMRQSMALLGADPIDLMQVHNLVDWQTHLATLRAWKDEGRVRYLGITHYTAGAFAELEAVMRAEPLDFVQLNYSLADRAAERRLLPLAAERGIAVLVNVPFGGGGLLRRLARVPLPDWAGTLGCESWSQTLLKYVLGHPAVTCAIPGSGDPAHMADNSRAASEPLPDEALRRRMAADWDRL
jgi:aryl-alcohol dehydrogenase-like predicted oxidoreductase